MADYAHTETDKRIAELEKRLQAEYRQAYKETKGKLEKYLSDFARKDEAKRELVEKGEMSQADYTQWRKNQILTGKRWAAMVETLAKDINRTNQIAADIISGDLKGTFALNANFTAYSIENGFRTDYGFTLYNEDTVNRLIAEDPDLLPAPSVDIPKDIRWNKQKISSNITQAVLQGKSIPDIAKGMQTVVGMNKAAATRNARTAMTGAQNAGRQASYDRAKAMGIKVKKEWIATLDGRTRHSHGMADGQQVEIDGKFTVGRAKMRYPGDFKNGSPEELYNCRCTMGTVEPPEILQGEDPRMTYQEWYNSKEKINAQKYKYTQAEQNEFAELQKKYKNKLAVMLFGTEEEILRYDYLLQKDKANAGTFDYYKRFQHQYISESRLNKWRVEPSTAERDAISSYSRSGYLKMNENLRFGKYVPNNVKKEIYDLQNYLDKCETQDVLYLSRGVTKTALDKMSGNDKWRESSNSLVGSVFTDKGFVSTTPYQGGGFGGDVIMYIKAPKGTKGAYIKNFAASSEEKEFLLQSNTSFVVRNIVEETDQWGDKKYKVFAEVIV